MTYKLVTDGSTDMAIEFYDYDDIVVIPMESTMEGEVISFLSYEEEKLNKYYEFMLEDKNVSTSQVNRASFEKYFTQILEEGYDFIYIGLTSGLSGTYDNASEVINRLRKKYPERKISIIEDYAASTGQGLVLQQLKEFKDQGMEYDQIVDWLKLNAKYITSQFGVDDLKYLYKGGRVSKTTAGVGNLLKVKPMLHIDMEGKLQVTALNRGKKNNMKNLVKNFKNSWMPEISDMVVIGYAYYKENAYMLKEMVKEEFPQARVYTVPIGALIGTHVGPGMYSLCYFGNNR
ncbi:MAG: DegV family protein [Peptoniphilaceae bacterium]|nr:DegV family protein [Peptoniphilaceae bacterium]MDY6018445.1 DegV family protein [Anaerococcus sp.]